MDHVWLGKPPTWANFAQLVVVHAPANDNVAQPLGFKRSSRNAHKQNSLRIPVPEDYAGLDGRVNVGHLRKLRDDYPEGPPTHSELTTPVTPLPAEFTVAIL
jgi:hypothetical protein